MMKTLPKLIAILFTASVLFGCTNDEGETEFDTIDPGNEQQLTDTQ